MKLEKQVKNLVLTCSYCRYKCKHYRNFLKEKKMRKANKEE
jgi:hypothetical protein